MHLEAGPSRSRSFNEFEFLDITGLKIGQGSSGVVTRHALLKMPIFQIRHVARIYVHPRYKTNGRK
jgi:hypothetical protein